MNGLNLQNDAFCEVANNITQTDNKIVAYLNAHSFVGTNGPWILLESFDSVLSEIQTWELSFLIYGTIYLRSITGITTFDEIKSKLE